MLIRHIDINPIAKHTFEAIEELEKTELEYTRIANGWFLDYFGMPHYKTRLEPWINVINMEKKWAVVPGDGSARATFITTQDMARFVARLLDLKKWPLVCSIVGQEMTLNELVALAEKIRGMIITISAAMVFERRLTRSRMQVFHHTRRPRHAKVRKDLSYLRVP